MAATSSATVAPAPNRSGAGSTTTGAAWASGLAGLIQVRSSRSSLREVCTGEGLADAGEAVTDDNGGSSGALVKHAADRMVEGGRWVKAGGGTVGEPLPESFQEPGYAMCRVPFAGRIEVDAEPFALEDVGVACEALVIDRRRRRYEREPSRDGDGDVLAIGQGKASVDRYQVPGRDADGDLQRTGSIDSVIGDDGQAVGMVGGDPAELVSSATLPVGELLAAARFGHPARPGRDGTGATGPNRPLVCCGGGALNPSPKMSCQRPTLVSSSGS
jgi:hypothetical protein